MTFINKTNTTDELCIIIMSTDLKKLDLDVTVISLDEDAAQLSLLVHLVQIFLLLALLSLGRLGKKN